MIYTLRTVEYKGRKLRKTNKQKNIHVQDLEGLVKMS
jgi:hypothetical protein